MTYQLSLCLTSLVLLLPLLKASQNVADSAQAETEAEDLHAASYQVYPVLRMKLTSSVLPGAIQMLTSYIEKLEQIQKTQEEITEHHSHTTSSTNPATDDGDLEKYDNSSTISSHTSTSSTTSQAPETSETLSITVHPEEGLTGTPLGYSGHPETPNNTIVPNTSIIPPSSSSTDTHEEQNEINATTSIPMTVTERVQSEYSTNPETSTAAAPLTVTYESGHIVVTSPISTSLNEGDLTRYTVHPYTSTSASVPTVQLTQTIIPVESLEIIGQTTTPNKKIENAVTSETTTASFLSAVTNEITQNGPGNSTPYNTSSEMASPGLLPFGTTIASLEQSEQHNATTSINSTFEEVEEIDIPDELYALTTTQYETANIPTEAYGTTTESVGSTNVYELNINEETIVDIELILGDETKDVNGSIIAQEHARTLTDDAIGGVRMGRVLRDDDMKKKTKTSYADRNGDKYKTSSATNRRPFRNTTSVNKFNQKLEKLNKPLPASNILHNKTSNVVKNTLQNILAQQRNKTISSPPSKPNKGVQTVTGQSGALFEDNNTPILNATRVKPLNRISSNTKPEDVSKFEPYLVLNHLKESYFNKTADDIFVKTLNDIIYEQKKLENNTSEDFKIKNGSEEDLMSKFWNLASFFTAVQNFLSGDLHLVQHAQNMVNEKKEENYLKNVTRQMMFLKIFYNIEAKNARLWRYHGYSKSATKFLKATSTLPPPKQLKETMSRLMDRGNIKHERTIEATRKFIEELDTPDSSVNRALNLCPTLRFT